jgi:hypothetical protein
MKHRIEELEFAISQYIDGTLNPLEQALLEEVLASDPSARAMLEEYRRLDAAMKQSLPQPAVDLDLLNARISSGLSKLDAPVRHYRLFSSMAAMKIVAVAASMLILIGIVVPMMRSRSANQKNEFVVRESPSGLSAPIVTGPSAEQASGNSVAQISIGAPPGLANAGWQDQAVITRTPRLVIESSALPAQDSDLTPY